MIHIRKLFLFILVVVIFTACEDSMEVVTPKLEITGYTTDTIQETDTTYYSVTFQLDEDADIISFYSGEFGSDYDYKDGHVAHLTDMDFSFAMNCNYGTQNPATQFSVLASPDFTGTLDSASIYDATWINITDRFTLANLIIGDTEYHSSGIGNLTDLFDSTGHFYVALRYHTPNQLVNGVYAAVRLKDWKLIAESDVYGSTEQSISWGLKEFGNLSSGRNSITSSLITLRGNTGSLTSTDPAVISKLTAETEAWVISNKLSKDTDLGPDLALPIKAVGDPNLKSFTQYYAKPGVYKVAFMASNVNVTDEKKIYKEYTISIPE